MNDMTVGFIIQLLAGQAVLSLHHTQTFIHIHTSTQTHACRCEINLNQVKAVRNDGEACFCLHKQLLRFHPTACPGGGWLKRESFPLYMFSDFPLLC